MPPLLALDAGVRAIGYFPVPYNVNRTEKPQGLLSRMI
jgi:hypothetical protein